MYQIASIRYSWPEHAGFSMEQKNGHSLYTFLHFYYSVKIVLNGQTITTKPHACIIFAPGTPQQYSSPAPLLYDWFYFSSDTSLPEGLACDTVFYPDDPTYVTTVVRRLESEYFKQLSSREHMLHVQVSELFYKLARNNLAATPAINHRLRQSFRKLRNDIFMHPERHWSVAEMSASLFLGTSHFHNLYRLLYNCSPYEDLIASRIRYATDLLKNTNHSVAQIAETCGYNNASHFSRQFRAQTGMSPNAFRQSHQNNA